MRARGIGAAGLSLVALLSVTGCAELLGEGPRRVRDLPPAPDVSQSPPREPDGQPAIDAPAGRGPADLTGRAARQPFIQHGTRAAPGPSVPARAAGIDGGGDVTLNFVNADIREVVRAVLGEILNLNYVVDPQVQGTVTVQTSQPLARSAVLPTLETVLRSNNATLVEADGLYRVVPLDEASRGAVSRGTLITGAQRSLGFGIQVLPLRFASALELQGLLEPFVPAGGVLQADATRNLLLVSGTRQDLEGFSELVATFDVDWMAGMSFGLFPLRSASARTLAVEIGALMAEQPAGSPAGVLRFVPLERMNAILVISPQPRYLEFAQSWIERLDEGANDGVPRLYVYQLQNGRAVDLADVLGELFGGRSRAATGLLGSALSGGPPSGPSAFGQQGQSGQGPSASASPTSSSSAALTPPVPPSPSGAQTTRATGGSAARRAQTPSGTGAAGTAGAGAGAADMPNVRFVADERNNTLIVYASPRDYRMIETTLKQLDVVPVQVLIEATVAEVTLNDNLRYGLQWFLRGGANSATLSDSTASVPAQVFPGVSYLLNTADARVVLNALSAITDVNVISSPQLMVLDQHAAYLQVGDSVPVPVQQARSIVTPDAPIVNTIQYRDTGVILRVTPRVNTNGLVRLEIEQEVSDVALTTTSTIDAPTIQQRRIFSTVAVQGGETVALGGLIRDSRSKGRSGVPLLSDIPLLGLLFRSNTDNTARTELLVLISPRIVRTSNDARQVTDELRQRLRTLRSIDARIR